MKTKSFKQIKLDIQEINVDSLSIFLGSTDIESDLERHERSTNSEYSYEIFSPEMFIEVKRKIDNKTILSTARGALIAGENYFEWTIYLNSKVLMGFDELQLKEGQRILVNNEHTSIVPYVVAFGR